VSNTHRFSGWRPRPAGSALAGLALAKRALAAAVLATLSACASVSLEQNLARVNDEAGRLTGSPLALARTDHERTQRLQAAQAILDKPLAQDDAVRLALVNSAALQALLANGWAQSADAAQAGRVANPVFHFERLATGAGLEIGRALSFGLVDVLTLPARQRIADGLIEQSQLRLIGEVIDHVTRIRQAWVRAVAAAQQLEYARQVFDSAEASADLARRMQAAGNFNRIRSAREHAFHAEAATRLASAGHQASAAREALIRLLGLDDEQARALKLPAHLPELPAQALEPQAIGALATRSRLDIRLAQAALDAAARAQGLNAVTRFADIELTARRDTAFDDSAGTRTTARGWEVGLRLPVLDWGNLQRDAMNARTLAAANQLEATLRAAGSAVRESYSAYRTAHGVARQYRDEIIPLRKTIAEENLLRYNAMLISVFELLADAREQAGAVIAAIEAEQQFWLADAALQASLHGVQPTP
jgi:outer membrane protein TolC